MSGAGLAGLASAQVATAALLAARIGGLMLAAPLFSSRVIPVRVRTVLLVLLTALLMPGVPAAEAGPGASALLAETAVGVSIGLAAGLYIGAAAAAGDLLAIQMGLAGASTLNPLSEEQLPVLGQFAQLAALAIVLSLGGHLLILESLRESVIAVPLGGPIDVEAGLAGAVTLGGKLFLIALRLAAPVVAVLLLGNVILGVLGRAVPQMNLLMVAFPVQIGIGLLALAALFPVTATLLGGWPFDFGTDASGLFDAFSGG